MTEYIRLALFSGARCCCSRYSGDAGCQRQLPLVSYNWALTHIDPLLILADPYVRCEGGAS